MYCRLPDGVGSPDELSGRETVRARGASCDDFGRAAAEMV